MSQWPCAPLPHCRFFSPTPHTKRAMTILLIDDQALVRLGGAYVPREPPQPDNRRTGRRAGRHCGHSTHFVGFRHTRYQSARSPSSGSEPLPKSTLTLCGDLRQEPRAISPRARRRRKDRLRDNASALSIKTLSSYRDRILETLNLRTTAEQVLLAGDQH